MGPINGLSILNITNGLSGRPIACEPVPDIIIEIALVTDPSTLRNMVSGSGAYRIVGSRVTYRRLKFGLNPSVLCPGIFEGLMRCPPTIVINTFDGLIRQIDKGNICFKPGWLGVEAKFFLSEGRKTVNVHS